MTPVSSRPTLYVGVAVPLVEQARLWLAVVLAGVPLPQLQKALAAFRPELVLLNCHAREEGCLVLGDGRGRAEYVGGERLPGILPPRPKVLILAACHSESVLNRAAELA